MQDDFKAILSELIQHNAVSLDRFKSAFSMIFSEKCNDVQIAAFLTALRMSGETKEQLVALATILKTFQQSVNIENMDYLVDNCGTGGDASNLFNISTAAAFVAAGAGAKVAKHGNRSVSSKTGSADVLEALGAGIHLSCERVSQCLSNVGMAFMFAPQHHGVMKYIAHVRRSLECKTIFNLMGPLLNPANVKRQVLGVFDKSFLEIMAHALVDLGAQHVLVVHSEDGLNEVSIAQPTHVCEYVNGVFKRYSVSPEDFNLTRCSNESLRVNDSQESMRIIKNAFSGRHEAASLIVALNAGAALYVSGVSQTWQEGVQQALKTIESGDALKKMNAFIEFTRKTG